MAGDQNGGAITNNITVTERSDLSTLYKGLRAVIRPLRPRLVDLGQPLPAGSPQLKKHPRRIGKVAVAERRVELPAYHAADGENGDADANAAVVQQAMWTYEFHAPAPQTQKPNEDDDDDGGHVVYYFAGGGFQAPAKSEHWKFCAYLAAALAPAHGRVVMVSYPLAPHSPAKDSLPLLRRWLRLALREAGAARAVVTLLGDSAGANVALSLGLWCADQRRRQRWEGGKEEEQEEEQDCWDRLVSVLAVSPPTDMRNQHPDLPLADAKDPVLARAVTDGAAAAWSRGADKLDPYLSPNLADLTNARACGLRIDGVIATADLLAPDALVFLDKCKKEGVRGSWLVWDGQMHCIPLAACYGLKEGKESRDWIVKTLMEVRG